MLFGNLKAVLENSKLYLDCVFSDPADPISPKDKPTRVPYSPKHPDSKDTHKNNEVLEKPGEFIFCHFKMSISGN